MLVTGHTTGLKECGPGLFCTHIFVHGGLFLVERNRKSWLLQRSGVGNPSSQSSQNTTPENLDFIREGSFWVTESLLLPNPHWLAWKEALLKMFQATIDLGISVLFSSSRLCACCGDPAGPRPHSPLLESPSWKMHVDERVLRLWEGNVSVCQNIV